MGSQPRGLPLAGLRLTEDDAFVEGAHESASVVADPCESTGYAAEGVVDLSDLRMLASVPFFFAGSSGSCGFWGWPQL